MPMPPCCPARPDDDGDVPVMSGDLLYPKSPGTRTNRLPKREIGILLTE